MQFQFPAQADEVIDVLSASGFEAYFVGGCVRDQLLGRPVYDYDITTNAHPEQVKALFSKTVDTGIKNGTVTVINGALPVEVTTYRADGVYLDSRHPEDVTFVHSLREDVIRRDFTVNALCYNSKEGLVDFVGGLDDLKAGLLRAIGRPEKRFQEDALRMLRAVRFCSTLGFQMEAQTQKALLALCQLIRNVSAERIQAEFQKILLGPRPEAISDVSRFGLMKEICPALDEALAQREESGQRIGAAEPDLSLRLALLLYAAGESRIEKILTDLRFSRKQTRDTIAYVKLLTLPMPQSRAEAKRLMAQYGEKPLLRLAKAKTAFGEDLWGDVLKEVCSVLSSGECFRLTDLAVNGDDLLLLGFSGSEVGTELHTLLDAVIDRPSENQKEKLLEIAKSDKIKH